MTRSDKVGIQRTCICPDVLDQYIGDWFYVYTDNDTDAFFGLRWQLVDVGLNYIVVRRPVVDLDGTQTAILFCHQIVGLVEAPPEPING